MEIPAAGSGSQIPKFAGNVFQNDKTSLVPNPPRAQSPLAERFPGNARIERRTKLMLTDYRRPSAQEFSHSHTANRTFGQPRTGLDLKRSVQRRLDWPPCYKRAPLAAWTSRFRPQQQIEHAVALVRCNDDRRPVVIGRRSLERRRRTSSPPDLNRTKGTSVKRWNRSWSYSILPRRIRSSSRSAILTSITALSSRMASISPSLLRADVAFLFEPQVDFLGGFFGERASACRSRLRRRPARRTGR